MLTHLNITAVSDFILTSQLIGLCRDWYPLPLCAKVEKYYFFFVLHTNYQHFKTFTIKHAVSNNYTVFFY